MLNLVSGSRVCRALKWLAILGSMAIVAIALGADQLGLDSDLRWGPARLGMLILGSAALFILLVPWVLEPIDRRLIARRTKQLGALAPRPREVPEAGPGPDTSHSSGGDAKVQAHVPSTEELDDDRAGSKAAPPGSRILARVAGKRIWHPASLVAVFLAVELLYGWLVSVGHWTLWPDTTAYYDLLAEAFLNGQVSLLIEPPPALEGFENPYPTANRRGIEVVPDASYFDGKYYLYWGPAPALGLTLVKLGLNRVVGDQYIVFAAVSGIFLFSTLTLLYIRNKQFPLIPPWLLTLSVVVVGSIHPMLWVLNRPAIHEAAIASAQTFLVAGLFFALPLLDGSRMEVWRIALVGTLWSLAIATRATLALPIGALVVATALELFRNHDRSFHRSRFLRKVLILLLPMIVTSALLGAYNLVRFGNVLEFGLRYVLSGWDLGDLIQSRRLFSPQYLAPNVIFYLFTPLRTRAVFPFVRPVWEEFAPFQARLRIPGTHHIEDVVGLLFAAPFLLFTIASIAGLLCNQTGKSKRDLFPLSFSASTKRNRDLDRLSAFLLAVGLLGAVPILLYFWVANRYFLDGVPVAGIAAALGSWRVYRSNEGYPARRFFSILVIVLAVLLSLVVGLLLAISGADTRFDDLNPKLYDWLAALFSK